MKFSIEHHLQAERWSWKIMPSSLIDLLFLSLAANDACEIVPKTPAARPYMWPMSLRAL